MEGHVSAIYYYMNNGLNPNVVFQPYVDSGLIVQWHGQQLPSGDYIGVAHVTSGVVRKQLAAMANVHPFPAVLFKQLTAAGVNLLAYAGVVTGDTVYDAMLKVATYHKLPWMHPEESHHSTASVADLFS